MENFYNSFSFIMAFTLLTLIFNVAFGSKFVEMFLLLVLLSMVVVNSDKVGNIFKGIKEA